MKKTENKNTIQVARNNSSAQFKNIVLGIVIGLFCLSLFKNISYPLIWNDESETVMMATHVLEYGYPKVHDEKNTVFMMPVNHMDSVKNFRIGYNKEYDAFIGNTWGMYYFGALGVIAANTTSDIYKKTFWIRTPFALSALIGLVIFCLCCYRFFPEGSTYRYFVILFLLIEMMSVSLIYHMREARYYSLTILAVAWVSYIYINYFFFKKYSKVKYVGLLIIALTTSYHINFITFAILAAFLALHETIHFTYACFYSDTSSRPKIKDEITKALPTAIGIIASTLLAYPFISFFDTINISQHVSNDYNFSIDTYKGNLLFIYEFFKQQDFYYAALTLTCVMLICLWKVHANKKSWNNLSKTAPILEKQLQLFLFFITFFFVYTLMIARSPYLFARHFIVLQPVLTLLICLDIFLIVGMLDIFFQKKNNKGYKIGLGIMCLFLFLSDSTKKIQHLKDHIYQCTHQMKGVLDYTIPYILENFKEPEKLTIATNYEEFALMYYLKSKVIVGFIANELEEAMRQEPDIIIYRKGMGGSPVAFNHFLQKAKYNRVAFPVYDYPVNNIPEIEFMIPHLFRTKFATQENEKADILIKDTSGKQ